MATDQVIRILIASLPVVSLLALAGGIGLFATLQRGRKKGVKARKTTVLATAVALIGAANGAIDLGLKASGVHLQPPDAALATLSDFYPLTANPNTCARSWAFIHSARRAWLATHGIQTERDFCATYATTQEYRNLRVHRVKSDSSLSRRYVVEFDVRDQFPSSSLYSFRTRRLSDALDAHLLDRSVVIKEFSRDLHDNFVAPDSLLGDSLESFLGRHPLDFLLSPEAVADAGRYLRLVPVQSGGPTTGAWTHFVQIVTMEPEDGWKIKSGLYPPVLRVPYPAGAEIPNP